MNPHIKVGAKLRRAESAPGEFYTVTAVGRSHFLATDYNTSNDALEFVYSIADYWLPWEEPVVLPRPGETWTSRFDGMIPAFVIGCVAEPDLNRPHMTSWILYRNGSYVRVKDLSNFSREFQKATP